MMYYIKGELCELFPDRAVVECGSVGYCAMITAKTYDKLVADGAYTPGGEMSGLVVKLYTTVRIKDENSFEVFGFARECEMAMFRLLQTVSGIGTRAALSILSALSVESVCTAIATEDTKLISTAQGVGNKAAQKICIDLKNKLEAFMLENGVGIAQQQEILTDKKTLSENEKLAVEALVNLGYTKVQAQKAVSKASGSTVEELIRTALASLY